MTDYELLCKPSIEKRRVEIKAVMSISMIKMTLSENAKDVLIVKTQIRRDGSHAQLSQSKRLLGIDI